MYAKTKDQVNSKCTYNIFRKRIMDRRTLEESR
jgi:hypothetical protein